MRVKKKIAIMISVILIAVLMCSLAVTAAESDDNVSSGVTNTSGLFVSGGEDNRLTLQTGDAINAAIYVGNNTSEDIYFSGASLKYEAIDDPFGLFPETIAQNTIGGTVPAKQGSYLRIPASSTVPDTAGILDESTPAYQTSGYLILEDSSGNEIGRKQINCTICRPVSELIVSVESETGEVWEGVGNSFSVQVENPTKVDATGVYVSVVVQAEAENWGTVSDSVIFGPMDIMAGSTAGCSGDLYLENNTQWLGPIEEASTYLLARAESTLEFNGMEVPVFSGEDRCEVEYHKAGEDAHTHIWEAERAYDETYCWRPCSVEGCTAQDNKLKHALNFVIDIKPTEEMDGKGHYECDYGCGYESESFPVAYYAPTASAELKEWTGNEDIIISVDAKGGILAEDYPPVEFQNNGEHLCATAAYNAVINMDENGKGTITITNEEVKDMIARWENAGIDFSSCTTISIYLGFANLNVDPVVTEGVIIDIPYNYSPSESEETVTLEDESGVTMTLPESESENMQLKVVVTNGETERYAVEKVVQIDENKIQTFDVSLLKNGEPYVYNGQFESVISLPIPGGWDINRLVLYYYNDVTGEVESVPFSVDIENSMVTFNTTHFSKYVLAQKAVSPSSEITDNQTNSTEDNQTLTENETGNKIPQTGDADDSGLYTAILIIVGFAIVAFVCNKKMQKNR